MTTGIRGGKSVDPFDREHETQINGRRVSVDTELTIRRLGRCRFKAPHRTSGAVHVEVINARGQWRAANVDDVVTVHRVAKTRENAS